MDYKKLKWIYKHKLRKKDTCLMDDDGWFLYCLAFKQAIKAMKSFENIEEKND